MLAEKTTFDAPITAPVEDTGLVRSRVSILGFVLVGAMLLVAAGLKTHTSYIITTNTVE